MRPGRCLHILPIPEFTLYFKPHGTLDWLGGTHATFLSLFGKKSADRSLRYLPGAMYAGLEGVHAPSCDILLIANDRLPFVRTNPDDLIDLIG